MNYSLLKSVDLGWDVNREHIAPFVAVTPFCQLESDNSWFLVIF